MANISILKLHEEVVSLVESCGIVGETVFVGVTVKRHAVDQSTATVFNASVFTAPGTVETFDAKSPDQLVRDIRLWLTKITVGLDETEVFV